MGDNMKKNRVFSIVFGLFCVVIFLTIGYSAFSDSLNIGDATAKVRIYKDIRVTGVSVSLNNSTVTDLDYDTDGISSKATLNQNGTITYNVTVKNLGPNPMAIYSIDTSNLPSDLKILSTSGYDFNNKEKICDDSNSSICTLNATKTFTITIGYNNYVSNSTIYNISLGFEFVPIYDVVYSNITVGNNYPTHAYYGKTFSVSFQNDIPYAIELSENFQKTYSNNTLTVQNPTSGFTINRYYHISYNLDGGTQAANQPDRYLAGNSVTLLDPTKTDYTFQGWYDNSGFTGTALTNTSGRSGDLTLYAKWEANSSGGGMGTPEHPHEDNTTQTYDPDNVPANSTILYTAVEGEPQVTTDEDGNITSFEYTDTGSGISVPTNGVDTGILAFDGNDFVVTLTAKFKRSDIDTSKANPVLDMSFSDGNGSVNGFLVIMSSNYGGTSFNETGTSITNTTSSNPYLKFRFNKYVSGNVDSTESRDYYSKFSTNAYYSNRFATQTEPITLTIKIYCRSNIFTSDLIYNDDIIGRPKYASKNNEKQFSFATPVVGATVKLGTWYNKDGELLTSKFDIVEFSVVKS